MRRLLAEPLLEALLRAGAACAIGWSGQGFAAEEALKVSCLPDRAVIFEGQKAELRAWAVAAGPPVQDVELKWMVKLGSVSRDASRTMWDLSDVMLGAKQKEVASAEVRATATGRQPGTCRLQVVIMRQPGSGQPEPTRGEIRLAGRAFLLPNQNEEAGYGLYSYLLLSSEPRNAAERERYLHAIERFLLSVQDINDFLARHVPPSQLNIAYLPVKRTPDSAQSKRGRAENVLKVYDYAAAQILLGRLEQDRSGGPYLVAVLNPLRDKGRAHLLEDLNGVEPELAGDWIDFFISLAAQERSWAPQAMDRLGLNLRNVIAAGGAVTPQIVESLPVLIRFVKGKP